MEDPFAFLIFNKSIVVYLIDKHATSNTFISPIIKSNCIFLLTQEIGKYAQGMMPWQNGNAF